MSTIPNNTDDFYQDYEERLARLISQESNGKIPDAMCKRLAHNGAKRKMYDDANGNQKLMMQYADALIWAYYQ